MGEFLEFLIKMQETYVNMGYQEPTKRTHIFQALDSLLIQILCVIKTLLLI